MNPPKHPLPASQSDTAETIDIHDGQPPPRVLPEEEEEAPLKPGSLLVGRYTTLNQLGRGGMGVVYAVYDAKLDRRVALKLLRRRYDNPASASGHARLLREAKAMARLNHPNVVSVYDVGTSDEGDVFVAMELVEGQTLTEWLRGGRRSWQEILAAFVAAGRGLAAAHAAGMIHRDFKTDNVLMGARRARARHRLRHRAPRSRRRRGHAAAVVAGRAAAVALGRDADPDGGDAAQRAGPGQSAALESEYAGERQCSQRGNIELVERFSRAGKV